MPTENETSGASAQHRPPRPSATKIGNHKLKAQTLMLGYGFDPELSEGSLKPPIFLTSTFAFESAAAGKRFFEGVTGRRPGGAEGLIYSRFNGPNQEILEDRLALWEEADDSLAFSSGMAAIATLLLTFVRPGDVIVQSGPLYAATETMIAKILGQFGVSWLDFPSGATREEIDAVIAKAKEKGRVSLIYVESPANPTNQLVDVEAVAAARDAAFGEGERPPIAIDNTFLGPLWSKPLAHGADLSVYSLTKYVGGHSDLVAGGIVGKQALIDQIRAIRNTIGTIVDPNTAWMLLRSLETLELRMTRAGENAAKVCQFLRQHPKVEKVGYLGFLEEGTRQADIFRRHKLGAGSTFSLYLKGGEKEAFAFLDALEIANLAVSLGGTETLASAPAAMTHLSVPDERKAQLDITPNLVRISIGVEDADDLIADFANALNAV
ncbi:MAG TPA: cystathionine gamma-synthase family protein [Sphingomicrobium sp.]|nr:cystathionine gamma-synthase family protein [Sphingomicrobium sp.]